MELPSPPVTGACYRGGQQPFGAELSQIAKELLRLEANPWHHRGSAGAGQSFSDAVRGNREQSLPRQSQVQRFTLCGACLPAIQEVRHLLLRAEVLLGGNQAFCRPRSPSRRQPWMPLLPQPLLRRYPLSTLRTDAALRKSLRSDRTPRRSGEPSLTGCPPASGPYLDSDVTTPTRRGILDVHPCDWASLPENNCETPLRAVDVTARPFTPRR